MALDIELYRRNIYAPARRGTFELLAYAREHLEDYCPYILPGRPTNKR